MRVNAHAVEVLLRRAEIHHRQPAARAGQLAGDLQGEAAHPGLHPQHAFAHRRRRGLAVAAQLRLAQPRPRLGRKKDIVRLQRREAPVLTASAGSQRH